MIKKFFKTIFFSSACLFFSPLSVYAYYDDRQVISWLFGVILLSVVIFLIFREVFCWYWKINERVALLKEIRELLKVNQKMTLNSVNNSQIKLQEQLKEADGGNL